MTTPDQKREALDADKLTVKAISYENGHGLYKVQDQNTGQIHVLDFGVGCVVKHPEYVHEPDLDKYTTEKDWAISHEQFMNGTWNIEANIPTSCVYRASFASLSPTDEVTDEDILRILARCCRAAGNLAETAFTRVFAQCLAEQGYTITRRK